MNVAKEIKINGIVQGVGFRPFIYKIAIENDIKGWVKNTSSGVIIEAYGKKENIEKFIFDIDNKKPPISIINSIKIRNISFKNLSSFKILKSDNDSKNITNIPVDLAICKDCEKEIFDIKNRRYLYPFTNCTNCGPRFSIVKEIPYDRPLTTMSSFKMCNSCLIEYENSLDRRFHAQPNACSQCGPYVWTEIGKDKLIGDKAIDFIVDKIVNGNIVAIKGLGGFHIACDAFNKKSVKKLRNFKNRPHKPFAIMVNSIKDIEKWIYIKDSEREVLNSYKAPIVMLKKKDIKYFNEVSPDLNTVGVMLPYTPLHKIIFWKLNKLKFSNPLIMTSGNMRDEPIIKDNEKAKIIFKSFDYVLYHNRPIHNRIDDSVVFVDSNDKVRLIRRARGYVPESIKLSLNFKENILSSGGDIKNTFALSRGNEIFLSQHIGDMHEKENQDFYIETIYNMEKLLDITPEVIVYDMHPNYYSSLALKTFKAKHIKVQHHIAHILSVMAEKNLKDNILGVSFDGTGYGYDGKIWGGEFFIIKNKLVKRVAHFKYFPLPGGDICMYETWRILLSIFYANRIPIDYLLKNIEKNKIKTILKMIDLNINSPLTSSVGRIFDAFSVLINGDFCSTYEAQGPIKLESLVKNKPKNFYKFDILDENGLYLIETKNSFLECLSDLNKKTDKAFMSEKLHMGIVKLIVNLLIKLRNQSKINTVCFSGGVFQNRILLDWLSDELKKESFDFYFNEKVPSNDGGIALGQIYYYILNLKYATSKML